MNNKFKRIAKDIQLKYKLKGKRCIFLNSKTDELCGSLLISGETYCSVHKSYMKKRKDKELIDRIKKLGCNI
jgi:hypothetical protein